MSVGGGGTAGNTRTYLVTTQAPPSAAIPVAKVLPQPVVSTAAGPYSFRGKQRLPLISVRVLHNPSLR